MLAPGRFGYDGTHWTVRRLQEQLHRVWNMIILTIRSGALCISLGTSGSGRVICWRLTRRARKKLAAARTPELNSRDTLWE